MTELHFGPMEVIAVGIAVAIIQSVCWYRFQRPGATLPALLRDGMDDVPRDDEPGVDGEVRAGGGHPGGE